MADGLSNSAKLLRGYMRATGITDAKVIAADLGINIRTIYRLKLDLADADMTAICATDGTPDSAITAKTATGGAAKTAICATDGTPTCNQQKEIPPTPPKEKTTTTQNYPHPLQRDAGASSARSGGGFWADAMAVPSDEPQEVIWRNGRVELVNGAREFWEGKLGANGLDLALIEASANVQRNSQVSLKLQVERQLAKFARDKADKDARYDRAVKANAKAPPPAKPSIPIYMQRY